MINLKKYLVFICQMTQSRKVKLLLVDMMLLNMPRKASQTKTSSGQVKLGMSNTGLLTTKELSLAKNQFLILDNGMSFAMAP